MSVLHTIQLVSAAIQLLATGAILLHAGRALLVLGSGRGIDTARRLLAEGVLAALGFSLAATLLNVIGLGNWTQIRTFTVVLVLRTLLKQVFQQEQRSALTRQPPS